MESGKKLYLDDFPLEKMVILWAWQFFSHILGGNPPMPQGLEQILIWI
jgi:hypothetical protein